MIIRIADIPPEGREIDFDLDQTALNRRVERAQEASPQGSWVTPTYRFGVKPHAHLKLSLEGSTVSVNGKADASYATQCSRCVEEVTRPIHVPIDILLKPNSQREARPGSDQEDADLSLAFYNGVEVDCGSLIEDFLILALPFTVLCSQECKGLCPVCGVNLNAQACNCQNQAPAEGPFSALKQLKIH